MPAPSVPTRNGFSSILDAIAAMKAGKFVVVMDHEDRENEGDLILPAAMATEEALAFMIRHSSGIVCVPALRERLAQLQLPLMVHNNTEAHQCKFTISVDLRHGNTTGVSAADRARTIRALADPLVSATAFNRPGHIFPLQAMDGGVLARAGHTEAAVDLARLAGCAPVGFICELNDANGKMLRCHQLQAFAHEHQLPLITISELIRYRCRTETMVDCQQKSRYVKTPDGDFQQYEFTTQFAPPLTLDALVYGDVDHAHDVLVHIVHQDHLEDVIHAQFAQQDVRKQGRGIIVFIKHASEVVRVSGDLMARQSLFGLSMQVVKALGVQSVRILSKTPSMFDLQGFGVPVVGLERLEIDSM